MLDGPFEFQYVSVTYRTTGVPAVFFKIVRKLFVAPGTLVFVTLFGPGLQIHRTLICQDLHTLMVPPMRIHLLILKMAS